MKDKQIFSILTITLLLLVVATVKASNVGNEYTYLIGTGDPGPHGPDIAMADNGDTVTIVGSGTFKPRDKAAAGSGTFIHKDAAGNEIGRGTWTSDRLVSFKTYGSGELQGLPPETEGGLALINVHLVADSGLEADAIMQIDCLLGKPPAGAKEGIRLAVQDLINFNKEVSGDTVFIRNS